MDSEKAPPVVSSPGSSSPPINNSSSSSPDIQNVSNINLNENTDSQTNSNTNSDRTIVSGQQEKPVLADPDEGTLEKSRIGEQQLDKPVSEVSMNEGVEKDDKVEVLGGKGSEGVMLNEDSGGVGNSLPDSTDATETPGTGIEGNTDKSNSSIDQVKDSGGEVAVGTELKEGEVGSTQDEVKGTVDNEKIESKEGEDRSAKEEVKETVVESEKNETSTAEETVASSNLKEAEEPTSVVEESPIASSNLKEAEEPTPVVEESPIASSNLKEAEEPTSVTEESAIASSDLKEAKEPTSVTEESAVASSDVKEAEEPTPVIEESATASSDVKEAEVPTPVIEESAIASSDVKEGGEPTSVVEESAIPSDDDEKPNKTVVEPSESLLVDDADGEKFTSEGDAVVDAIEGDVAGPGVAVVGDAEESKKVEEPVQSTTDENATSVKGVGETTQLIEEAANMTVDEEADIQNSKPAVDDNVAAAESKPVTDNIVDAGSDGKLDSGDFKTGDVVAAPEEIKEAVPDAGSKKLDVKDAEVEPQQAVSKTIYANGDHSGESIEGDVVEAEVSGQSSAISRAITGSEQDGKAKDQIDEEAYHEGGAILDEETDGMVFGSSEAARKFIEELERESGGGSFAGAEASHEMDGQIVTDSEEEVDTDEEGDGKELFDSAALAALLKAATGGDSDGGSITISSQDGSRLFSVERPAGLGSSLRSLRPAPRPNQPNLFNPSSLQNSGESENNLSEEEKKKLEKLQQIRVKFLRLIHRLGLSSDESIAAQVLYRMALIARRQNSPLFNMEAAKMTALQLEAEGKDDLDFSVNILVIGKSGVGKSATINSIFGEEKTSIDAFGPSTTSVKEISGVVDGVKIRVFDTPGLKSSVMEQGFNRNVLSSVKTFTKKNPPDIFLYVDRLDAQTRDLNDLPMLKTITSCLGPSIWRSAIVTLTHGASAPPDGPSGSPLSFDVFVTQRSHIVQQSIGQAVGDLRMMSPSLMNPVSLVENHPSCRKNREGQKILPNGQSWRPQLLLLSYSMKILSEASALSKPEDPFDHRKLFGFRTRSPPLPYMLSSMLQSRAHPKLSAEQGGDNGDSDIDLDDLSDSDQEEEDEYDQLPPFKPLRKAQLAKLSKEQRKAYFEEYDYRVKLLQKKQVREELRRMKEMKSNKGKEAAIEYGYAEEEADGGAAAPVAVPLPDMVLPPSFDSDNPAYRYRFLEPTSQFLARPVLDTHGWDHDCGYDGVNVEQSLAIATRFPAAVTVQVTKDKKDFSINLDSSVSAKHGDNGSTMAGFDIQSIGKQLAYIVRGETKFKNLKKNKTAAGISVTFLGENVVTGLKVEDQIILGKQYVLVGSAGTVRSQSDTAYGANFEVQRREADFPIGQVQSTLSLSVIKWRGDLALGFNSMAQFTVGRNSKVAVRAGINNKMSGQVTVRTSSSDQLSLALTAIIPTAIAIYRKLWPDAGEKYSIY